MSTRSVAASGSVHSRFCDSLTAVLGNSYTHINVGARWCPHTGRPMTGRLANRAAYAKELARLALLCAVTCAAGVANYVLFFLIGQYMPKWPSFLNIGQSIISALGFVVWLWVRDRRLRGFLRSDPHRADVLRRELERPAQEKRRLLCHYLFLGVLMAANGVCVQTADTHVSGALQSFLGIVVVPAGGLMAWRFLGERFPPLRIAGSVTVLAGIAAAVVPPLFEDSPPPDSHGVNSADWNGVKWVLLYLGGMLPYAAQSVYEEKLFAAPLHADPLRALTWSTLITVPIYLLYMPIDAAMRGNLSEFIQEQGDAMRCFIGDIEAIRDSGCRPYAGLMLTVFSLEYVLLLWLLAVLVEREVSGLQRRLVRAHCNRDTYTSCPVCCVPNPCRNYYDSVKRGYFCFPPDNGVVHRDARCRFGRGAVCDSGGYRDLQIPRHFSSKPGLCRGIAVGDKPREARPRSEGGTTSEWRSHRFRGGQQQCGRHRRGSGSPRSRSTSHERCPVLWRRRGARSFNGLHQSSGAGHQPPRRCGRGRCNLR